MKNHPLLAGGAIAILACVACDGNTTVIGGDLEVGPDTIIINPPSSPCSTEPSNLEVEVDPITGEIEVTDLKGEALIEISSSWYHVTLADDAALGASPGTYSAPPARSIDDLQVGLVATVANAASSTTCAPTGSALCTAATILELDGAYTGTGTNTGDTFSLSGNDVTGGLAPWPTCNAGPFLTGEPVAVTGLEGQVQ